MALFTCQTITPSESNNELWSKTITFGSGQGTWEVLICFDDKINDKQKNNTGKSVLEWIEKEDNPKEDKNIFWFKKLLHGVKHHHPELKTFAIIAVLPNTNQPTIFLGGWGNLNTKLYRENRFLNLPITPDGLCGPLQTEDRVVLGNPQFFSAINASHWKSYFNQKPSLATYLSAVLDTRTSALEEYGLVLHFQPQEKPRKKSSFQLPGFFSLRFFPKGLPHSIFGRFHVSRLFTEEQPLFRSKKRRIAASLAFFFLLLLGMSVSIGLAKRRAVEQKHMEEQLVEDVTYRLTQAESLKTLNPARAKTLLLEAKQLVADYRDNNLSLDLDAMQVQIDQAYSVVAHQFTIRQPDVFYNLGLIKEGIAPASFFLTGDELALVDKNTQTLVLLNIVSKAGEIIAGSDVIPVSAKVISTSDWIIIHTDGGIQIFDKQTHKQINSFTLSKIRPLSIWGYGSNAYLLDTNEGQVWRLRGITNGFAKPDRFFEEPPDIKNAIAMAVDGSVWLLYKDGGIEKYTSGVRDAYYPSLALDNPITSPDNIYTDEESQNLYIYERKSNRIVAVSKNGEVKGEYIWEGLGSANGFVVSEKLGKLLILSGSTIYGIDLKN